MSVWNKILGIAVAAVVLSAPSFADGVQGAKVNRGPAPLKARAMTPPEPGCVLVEGNQWACPVPPARFTTRSAPMPAPQYHPAPAPVTRTVTRSAPTTTRRVVTSSYSAAPQPQTVALDLAAFDGGVGNGVDGNIYGGGGAIFIGGDKRFSGVLSHRASAFTFQRRSKYGGGKGGHGPKPAPCGCH